MRRTFRICTNLPSVSTWTMLWVAATLMAGAPLRAEEPDVVNAATVPVVADPVSFPMECEGWSSGGGAGCPASRVWAQTDYLLWWVKGTPTPPLVTTGELGKDGPSGYPGVLGQPGTSILIGGSSTGLGTFSGGRFTLGGWLNDESTLGAEASYLFLGQRSVTQSEAAAASGLPVLSVPFFNARLGLPDSGGIADGSHFTGSVAVAQTLSLQGAEGNLLGNLVNRPGFRLGMLGGFRWLNLNESLSMNIDSPDVKVPGFVWMASDQFTTRNDFYGGQLGLRAELERGRFFFNGTAKAALGDVHESIGIQGAFTTNDHSVTPALTTLPGGYLALPTSIGNYSQDRFAVVPEVDLSIGYKLTSWAKVYVGYSFLYVSNVARPGSQIDPVVNTNQASTVTAAPPAPLAGPARPTFLGATSDFWAQGLNFGLQFSY